MTDQANSRDRQRVLYAHHEAGHAVATFMTVDGELDDECAVELVEMVELGSVSGHTHHRGSANDLVQTAFMIYAGPWAVARLRWGKPVGSLDDSDNGKSFRETVNMAFEKQGVHSDDARYNELMHANRDMRGNEPYWSRQLETVWSVIELLAGTLVERLAKAEMEDSGMAGTKARSASMTRNDVVKLVGPELKELEKWRYLRG